MNQKNCLLAVFAVMLGCASPEPEGLRLAEEGTGAEVVFDLFAKPLPEIPFPNDLATRFDPSSLSKRRINASMEAHTEWEKATRYEIDQLDGFGTYAPITVSFTQPLDVEVIYQRHQGDDYDFSDDAVLVLDVNADSPDFCQAVPLDMGEGNFPLTLERKTLFPNDPRGDTEQLVFEEVEEDSNRNGKLDPGEDTDMDGVLDRPNTRFPGAGRFETMTFYERETNTLIMKPVLPMRENNTYAVVLTRRLLDEEGRAIRSPFKYINHAAQTQQLGNLEKCLGFYGLQFEDVAFTWPFTTQSITAPFVAIRDGLMGMGPLSRLAEQFPAEVSQVHDLRTGSDINVKIVPSEQFVEAAKAMLTTVYGEITPMVQEVIDAQKFIDFHVVMTIESPQFFPRKDEQGKDLPLYKQTWKLNPLTGEAYVRPEKLVVWVTVPKNRNGRPAPVSILGHGYTGNKMDPLVYGGFFARYGLAALGMDAVSHGLPFGEVERELAKGTLAGYGLEPMARAMLVDRATDQNADGVNDSAADFWTSYMVHTRDVVRQSVVDYMRVIQVLKTFDGTRRWKFDVNKDGQPELAGDFNADGIVDIGGGASFSMSGGSLGGITSAMVGGLEPAIDAIIPIAGGAGLTDVGARSIQGGVVEAVTLRMMGPLMLTLRNTEGRLELWQYLPNLHKLGKLKIAALDVEPVEGDTAVLHNLKTQEYRCARVQAGGLIRASISSDQGDPLRFELYSGVLPTAKDRGCNIPTGTFPYWSRGELANRIDFQGKTFEAGSGLIAFGDGFGARRGTPELRRLLGLGQVVVDPADPINFAPFFEKRLLRYGTGEVVRTRALIVNTIGDMNVPMGTGASIARAAGFIDLREKDARYGKTPNRLLIDTGAIESVERVGRYYNSKNEPVHMDLEHLALETGIDDGFDAPRLNPPLRLVKKSMRVGGYSGVLFPMIKATGRHGFDPPNPKDAFDVGTYMQNILGRYMSTDGSEFSIQKCMEDSTCSWIAPKPME